MRLLELVRPVVRAVCRRSRRAWTNAERAHLELRALEPHELATFAAHVEAALVSLEAVHWVEVNGHLGRIIVAFEDITNFTEPELELIRKKVTMVFQSGALFDSLSVGSIMRVPATGKDTVGAWKP